MLFTLICVFFGLLLQSSAQTGADEPEPKCYPNDIDGWVEGNQNYPYDNGFPHKSLKDDCRSLCLKLKSTLFGLQRNGKASALGSCFCGNHTSGESSSGCSFKCGVYQNETCGGHPGLMSVYTVCPAGKFGGNCSTACTQDCHGNICSEANGSCPQCPRGWYNPPFCDSKCSVYCKEDICNFSGHCLACPHGYHGHDCIIPCSGACIDHKCHVVTGKCTFGCTPGWTGETCQQEQTEMNLTPIIASVVTAVVIAAVAVPLAVIIDRRKRRNRNSDFPNNATTKDQEPENANTEDQRPENVTTEDQRQEPAGQPTVDTNQGEYLALEDDAYEMVDERSMMNTDRRETESGYYHLPNQAPVYANWESTGPYEAVRVTNK